MNEATAAVAAVTIADDSSHGAGAGTLSFFLFLPGLPTCIYREPTAYVCAEPKRPGPGLPAISQETAVKALKDHPFEGSWKCALSFLVVELGRPSAEGMVLAY
jgi:hypothetical protein